MDIGRYTAAAPGWPGGDVARVSPEGGDVAPDPGQDGGLVLRAEVLGAEFRQVEEVAASHSVYVSQPEAVASVIAQAAAGPADR